MPLPVSEGLRLLGNRARPDLDRDLDETSLPPLRAATGRDAVVDDRGVGGDGRAVWTIPAVAGERQGMREGPHPHGAADRGA